ncbi:MAG TPA: tyrosine-type recombinase/integrase, partial [Candidatus Limnocylindrales bacterium]|nr:tyrosine-type recombinase/integrase [Candidatus Limnocylindrales bacterium]
MRAVAAAALVGLGELVLPDLVDEYLVALEVAGRSPRTIQWYRAFLREYLDFVRQEELRRPVLSDLSPVSVRRWLLAAQAQRSSELSPSSLAGRARTLRAFGGWVFREVGLPANPVAGLISPKVPDVLVPSLRESEMRGLLSAASTSRQSLRDQALVSLLLDTGIRLSELTALRVRDVDLVEGRCLVRGKGSRERLV